MVLLEARHPGVVEQAEKGLAGIIQRHKQTHQFVCRPGHPGKPVAELPRPAASRPFHARAYHSPVTHIRLPEGRVDPNAQVTDTARQVGSHDRPVWGRCKGLCYKRPAPHRFALRLDSATRSTVCETGTTTAATSSHTDARLPRISSPGQ